MTLNLNTLRAMYRRQTTPRRLLAALTHHGLRAFAATATGTVALLVYWNTLLGDIEIHYGPPALDVLQPTPVVSVATYILPLVGALVAGRYLARRADRSRHLATLVVALASPLVGLTSANVTPTASVWVVYPAIYVVLVALVLPPVALAAWVLDATARPSADTEAGHEVA